jgi:hypothetical protein
MIKKLAVLLIMSVVAWSARAGEPITGVAPASLDQPRVFVQVRRNTSAPPLVAKENDQQTSAVEAFLDTGASGIVIANSTATALGIKAIPSAHGGPIQYEDVGVGGSDKFTVSEPLWLSLADYGSNVDGDTATYGKAIGPMRCQINSSGNLLDSLTGGTDIAGMPVMQDRVVVMDPTGLAKLDKIKTAVRFPGDSAIPRVTRTVSLTYVSFARFGRITPAGSPGPVAVANPMIGPDPFRAADTTAPIRASYKGKSVKLTMLLDTGAACSMISVAKAKELGVTYAEDGTTLIGVPKDQQFSLPVGGIGGMKTSTGFYLDLLALPAKTGEPIVYAKAPLLVSDITVVDTTTQKPFTLDGVFGMNFLVASASLSGGALPDVDKVVDGPFQMIVIDHAKHTLGVK